MIEPKVPAGWRLGNRMLPAKSAFFASDKMWRFWLFGVSGSLMLQRHLSSSDRKMHFCNGERLRRRPIDNLQSSRLPNAVAPTEKDCTCTVGLAGGWVDSSVYVLSVQVLGLGNPRLKYDTAGWDAFNALKESLRGDEMKEGAGLITLKSNILSSTTTQAAEMALPPALLSKAPDLHAHISHELKEEPEGWRGCRCV